MYKILRWVAILSNKLNIDISATTGVHNAEMAIQLLLAGALYRSRWYQEFIETG